MSLRLLCTLGDQGERIFASAMACADYGAIAQRAVVQREALRLVLAKSVDGILSLRAGRRVSGAKKALSASLASRARRTSSG